MPVLQLEKVALHFVEHGSVHREQGVVLLIHGLGLDMSVWEEAIDMLRQNYRVIRYDMRGHGLSQETAGGTTDLTWEIFVQDAYRLLQSLGVGRASVIGHGFGADVAVKLCFFHPELVHKIVLISIPSGNPRTILHKGVRFRQKLIGRLRRSGPDTIVKDDPTEGIGAELAEEISTALIPHTDNRIVNDKIQQALSRASLSVYGQALELYTQDGPHLELARLAKPVLVLAGETDALSVFSGSLSTLAMGINPDRSFLIVPGAGNLPFIERPHTTVQWIEQFLGRAPVAYIAKRSLDDELYEELRFILAEGEKKLKEGNVLQVDLLRSFRVTFNGEEIAAGWNKRYAKRLLLYIMFHPAATREQICDALFPNIELNKAMRNLRVYLNHLRRLLGDEAWGAANSEIHGSSEGGAVYGAAGHDSAIRSGALYADREQIRMQCSVRCDLLDFIRLVHELRTEPDEHSKAAGCVKLLGMLPGQLIPGVYDDWILSVRSSLEIHVAELARWMAKRELKRGHGLKAADYLQIAARLLPEDETVYDDLISLYAKKGKHREAAEWAERKRLILDGT